jgi:hypothetical protein
MQMNLFFLAIFHNSVRATQGITETNGALRPALRGQPDLDSRIFLGYAVHKSR